MRECGTTTKKRYTYLSTRWSIWEKKSIRGRKNSQFNQHMEKLCILEGIRCFFFQKIHRYSVPPEFKHCLLCTRGRYLSRSRLWRGSYIVIPIVFLSDRVNRRRRFSIVGENSSSLLSLLLLFFFQKRVRYAQVFGPDSTTCRVTGITSIFSVGFSYRQRFRRLTATRENFIRLSLLYIILLYYCYQWVPVSTQIIRKSRLLKQIKISVYG